MNVRGRISGNKDLLMLTAPTFCDELVNLKEITLDPGTNNIDIGQPVLGRSKPNRKSFMSPALNYDQNQFPNHD